VVVVVACCGLTGYDRSAIASGRGGLLTETQVERIEKPVQVAITLEEAALEIRDAKHVDEFEGDVQKSGRELSVAQSLLFGHDLGGLNPVADLATAMKQDDEALARLRMHRLPGAAYFELRKALEAKRAALALLLQVPTTSASAPTLTGEAIEGSEPGTADIAVTPPGTGVDALRVLADKPITTKTDPPGWSCRSQTAAIVECKGPTTMTPMTMQVGYKSTAPPRLSLDGSSDHGKTFGRLTKLTRPGTTTPGATTKLAESCPSSVAQSQSIQITGTDAPPTSEPITITWTLPDGTTVVHTAIIVGPGSWKDAIGTSQPGGWHNLVSTPGAISVGCTILVGG
jgi:hypothetical protein